MNNNLPVEGASAEPVNAGLDFVSPNFFRTFGTEILAGRDFTDADAAGIERRAIVSRRYAEHFGLTPDTIVGRRLECGRRMDTGAVTFCDIIGVIGDLRSSGKVTDEIQPKVFFTINSRDTFYVRTTRPPEELIGAIRETVTRIDPTVPVRNLQTMDQQFRANIVVERFVAGTSTAFAVLATALAALGLYGVLAYSVAQRSREIGLRVALGAPTSRIRAMVLRQVARMAVIGVVLGVIAAWLLGRSAQSLLFGVDAGDPLALGAAAVVVAAVTLAAAYLPARRASRVDPMTVLRYE
jgi:hypothetical protein